MEITYAMRSVISSLELMDIEASKSRDTAEVLRQIVAKEIGNPSFTYAGDELVAVTLQDEDGKIQRVLWERKEKKLPF